MRDGNGDGNEDRIGDWGCHRQFVRGALNKVAVKTIREPAAWQTKNSLKLPE